MLTALLHMVLENCALARWHSRQLRTSQAHTKCCRLDGSAFKMAMMLSGSEHIKLPWRPESPCPCESGRAYKACCLSADGLTPRVVLPRLVPKGPLTSYANPKCYLRFTSDCSDRMSLEHYISRSVLEITKTFGLQGLPWQDPDEEVIDYGIENLASRILCERHNAALSPLDAMAARIYKIIMQIRDELAKPTQYDRGRWFIASGEALELWTIKTLCGLYFAKIAARNRGKPLVKDHFLDIEIFDRAIRGHSLPMHCGMWFRPSTGQVPHYVQAAPLMSAKERRVLGIRNRVFLIEADTIIDSTGVGFDLASKQRLYRPWLLRFSNRWRTHRLVLTWPGKMQGVAALNYSIEADPKATTPAPPLGDRH